MLASATFSDPATIIKTCMFERCETYINESKLILAEVLLDWPNQYLAKFPADYRSMNDAIQDQIRQTRSIETTANP